MRKEEIKPLPVVKAYTDYFIRKAKKALNLKKGDYRSISIDFNTRATKIHVWFHAPNSGIVGDIYFSLDGQMI